ncbi:uncharacterized protein PGTG_22719 [Puccinia graminis f. sp. tritici CRL 75-36-700-3]|uniref:Uncharacterized protein n=1 Tax=Puccinia graminis f. sp. tritici (strain CRL 75-36-700-3 / race SCCL) TaxID=418459 RepID=H6QVE4_PUCGT|nr:uncharacterized protein PGTG_22719 [Puccinia graminis f. sp. tritici CRL 75-36-700-3]EHS62898.1 hypothetical protein PGTG_22719 [Puccinia graminis f. sp. tritici CRL 75-36-700-3]
MPSTLVDQMESPLPAPGGIVLFNHSQFLFLPFSFSYMTSSTSSPRGSSQSCLVGSEDDAVACDAEPRELDPDEPTMALADPLMPPGSCHSPRFLMFPGTALQLTVTYIFPHWGL